MNRQIILLLFSIQFNCVYAQQEAATSYFWHTQFMGNPAFTGVDSRHAANAVYRNQWNGINGAPNTLLVNYEAKVDKIHGGAGISYIHDAIGFNRQHQVLGHYAFHQKIKEKFALSAGVSMGWMRMGFKPDWVTPTTVDDPSLPGESHQDFFQLNAGVAFIAENWRVGFGATQLNSGNRTASGSYSLVIHSRLYGEYRFLITENLKLIPRVQFITDYVKYSDSWALVLHSNKLWGGVSYSGVFGSNYIGAMIGYDFDQKYRLGYTYEYSTHKLSQVSKGTHEVVFSFSLDGFQQRPVILQSETLEENEPK